MTTPHLPSQASESGAPEITPLVADPSSETHLIEEIIRELHAQRDAVAADDLQEIDRCTHQVYRLLQRLAAAEKQRSPHTDDPAHRARVEDAARELQRELEITQRVLRGAIETNEEYIASLKESSPRASTPQLINRTV